MNGNEQITIHDLLMRPWIFVEDLLQHCLLALLTSGRDRVSSEAVRDNGDQAILLLEPVWRWE